MSKKSDINLFQYNQTEELAHGFSHCVGIVFGIFVLLQTLFPFKTTFMGLLFFSIALILVYSSSTLYHFSKHPKYKLFFKKCDHASIYILIAASYSPFLFIMMENSHSKKLATTALFFIWCFAFLGVAFKLWARHRHLFISVASYLALGWISLLLKNEMLNTFSAQVIKAIVWGGFFYTFGVIFYLSKRMKYHHVIWHFFVLAGSICHYLAIMGATRLSF